jgi:hypothetical protein
MWRSNRARWPGVTCHQSPLTHADDWQILALLWKADGYWDTHRVYYKTTNYKHFFLVLSCDMLPFLCDEPNSDLMPPKLVTIGKQAPFVNVASNSLRLSILCSYLHSFQPILTTKNRFAWMYDVSALLLALNDHECMRCLHGSLYN